MTLVPVIRSWDSPDIPDPEHWRPESHDEVCFLLQVEIGSPKSHGADVFQIVIATPEGLRARAGDCQTDEFVIEDRATLIVREYDWLKVEKHLRTIVSSCEGEDWVECSQKLQRYFHWEYEDYVVEGEG